MRGAITTRPEKYEAARCYLKPEQPRALNEALSGIAPDRLTAAAYGPMAERLAIDSSPNYLVVSYDVLRATVVRAEFIDGHLIDASRVHARMARGPTSRGAGWIGASIDFVGFERRVVVGQSLKPEWHIWKVISEFGLRF